MPRVHKVIKAMKCYPEVGINKGDTYYWWKFRFGGKRMSKTPPHPRDLTQSEFRRAVIDIDERLGKFAVGSPELARDEIESLVSDIRDLASEQEEKISNMPDSLQQGSTGELLQSRADSLEELASTLENIDTDFEREENESDDDYNERLADKTEEINREVSELSYDGE